MARIRTDSPPSAPHHPHPAHDAAPPARSLTHHDGAAGGGCTARAQDLQGLHAAPLLLRLGERRVAQARARRWRKRPRAHQKGKLASVRCTPPRTAARRRPASSPPREPIARCWPAILLPAAGAPARARRATRRRRGVPRRAHTHHSPRGCASQPLCVLPWAPRLHPRADCRRGCARAKRQGRPHRAALHGGARAAGARREGAAGGQHLLRRDARGHAAPQVQRTRRHARAQAQVRLGHPRGGDEDADRGGRVGDAHHQGGGRDGAPPRALLCRARRDDAAARVRRGHRGPAGARGALDGHPAPRGVPARRQDAARGAAGRGDRQDGRHVDGRARPRVAARGGRVRPGGQRGRAAGVGRADDVRRQSRPDARAGRRGDAAARYARHLPTAAHAGGRAWGAPCRRLPDRGDRRRRPQRAPPRHLWQGARRLGQDRADGRVAHLAERRREPRRRRRAAADPPDLRLDVLRGREGRQAAAHRGC
eukprot:3146919-Prymnesium_polylepis.1